MKKVIVSAIVIGIFSFCKVSAQVYTDPATNNVGIGTSSPSAMFKLDVNGHMRVALETYLEGNKTTLGDLNYGRKIYYSSIGLNSNTGYNTENRYLGRIGTGLYKITIYSNGYGAEQSCEFILHREWGSIPVMLQRTGGVSQIASLHYQDVGDNVHSDLFFPYTYYAPSGYGNVLYISVETLGVGDWSVASGITTPVLSTSNMTSVGLINSTSGNIGIGTSNPTEKLSVNGNIRTRKLIVTQNNWPDYVFDSSYTLPSLTHVEEFIKSNKHLPGIFSAKEITDKGLDVGEAQSQLLQKVEELTLYLIELKKENAALKERLDKLEKRN